MTMCNIMCERTSLLVPLSLCALLVCYPANNTANAKLFNPIPKNVVHEDEIVADITLENTLQALERIVFYFFKHKKDVTVDFAFGLRAAEGEISRILDMREKGNYLEVYPAVTTRLEELQHSIQVYVKQSFPFIENRFKEYFQRFYFLIKEKFVPYQLKPQYTIQNDVNMFPDVTQANDLDEDDSDLCMISLKGNNKMKRCSIDQCWKRMTTLGKFQYYPTHQLLWLLLGVKSGCKKQMDERAIREGYKHGIDDIIKRLCAGIVIEMEAISEKGISKGMLDIFLEQGFICGSIGIVDAVRPSWLKSVLGFQNPTFGCFLDNDVTDADMEKYKFWIDYKRDQWKSRNIFSESVLDDGCSTHATGLAAGFLAAYLRLFFDPFYRKHQYDPYIGVPVKESPMTSYRQYIISILCFCVVFLLIIVYLKRRIVQQVFTKTCLFYFAKYRPKLNQFRWS